MFMENYLSIDLESWAYPDIPEFLSLTSAERKKLDNGYVQRSVEVILKMLDKHNTKITFFIIAQLYDWYPETIEMIAREGHEIGYHTYTHDLLRSEDILKNSLQKSTAFLEKFKPKGFRAPAILMQKSYLKTLAAHGFTYDSSVYGDYKTKEIIDGVTEIPVSVFSKAPIGSGYFMGLLGNRIQWFYNKINATQTPVVCFIHNWQIVKPREATFPTRSYLLTHPHYFPYNLEIPNTFEHLLNNFQWNVTSNILHV